MSVADKIKEMSHKISEGYLMFNSDINDQISDMYNDGRIENKEILKRVCELVNQNIYLSLFHKGDVDKSNITFKYADYNKISNDISGMEESMNDYNDSPSDFRMEHTASQGGMSKTASFGGEVEKIASVHAIANFNSRVDNIVSNLESVRTDSIKIAEQSYIQMKKEMNEMNYNGESIDDITKIAMEFSAKIGLNFEKVGSAYDLIEKELRESGINVNRGITKVASQSINYGSEFFEPIEKFATAVDVIEAADEFAKNIAGIKVNG